MIDEGLEGSAADLTEGGGARKIELAAEARRLARVEAAGRDNGLADSGDAGSTLGENAEGHNAVGGAREVVGDAEEGKPGRHLGVLTCVQQVSGALMQAEERTLAGGSGVVGLDLHVVVEVVANTAGKEQAEPAAPRLGPPLSRRR